MSYTDIETRTQLVVFTVWSGDNGTGQGDRGRQHVMHFFEDVDDAIGYVDKMAKERGGDWDRANWGVDNNMPLLRRNGTLWMMVTRREIIRSSRRVRT